MSFPTSEPNKQPPFKPMTSLPNPYGDGASSGTTYAPGPGYGGPYGPPGAPPSGPPSRGNGCLIAGIVGGVLSLLFLCCGGFFALGFSVLDAEHKETARQLAVDYRADPKVREELGEIQEVSYNWSASMAREDDGLDVYDVRGDKGSGQLVVDAIDGEVLSVVLQNSRGEWDLPTEDAAVPMTK